MTIEDLINAPGNTHITTDYVNVTIMDGIRDGKEVRFYIGGEALSSAMYLEPELRYELVFDYTKLYNLFSEFRPEAEEVLMIGGAAYSYPKYFVSHYPGRRITVLDIDPMAEVIARRFFALDELIREYRTEETGALSLITADARAYFAETEKKYDIIMNDAFDSYVPAPGLATLEAAEAIHAHLAENGLYMTNLLGAYTGKQGRFLRSEIFTLRVFFRHVYLIPAKPDLPKDQADNYMCICSDAVLPGLEEPDLREEAGDMLLTDADAPVEEMAREYYR